MHLVFYIESGSVWSVASLKSSLFASKSTLYVAFSSLKLNYKAKTI